MRAWSLYTHSGKNPYAGHTGYDDVIGRHYSYDSDVANHRNIGCGDLVVVRDADSALGVAFIALIDDSPDVKTHLRCPVCHTSQLERRSTIDPEFRCTDGHEFEVPVTTEDPVTRYRASFGSSYLELTELTRDQLEELCVGRSRQNAMRELDLDRTLATLRRLGVFPGFAAT